MTTTLLAATMLAACSGGGATDDVASDYTLELRPSFVEGQSFLGESPNIKLLVRAPDGTTTLHALGPGSDDARLELPEQPALEAGTVIGLVAEGAGVPEDAIDSAATIAYGQTTVTEALATGGQQVTLDILMPRLREVGLLQSLGDNKLRMLGALAVVPGGDTYLFGGTAPNDALSTDPPPDKVLKLADHDLGATAFVNIDATLPQTTGAGTSLDPPFDPTTADFTGRIGLTATPVQVGGSTRILVTGGRQFFFTTDFDTDQALLFDPATETFETVKMKAPRSEHLAVPMAEGKVLIAGGLSNGAIGLLTYEIFDPERSRFVEGDAPLDLVYGELAQAGAPVGNFAMVCGGASRQGASSWVIEDGCNIIRPTGEVEVAAPLPVPLAGAAMAPLPDGGVLITGGFSQDYVDPDPGLDFGESPAEAGAWRYDPGASEWIEVGSLSQARAHHAAIALPSGEVLIVGGTETGTALYGDIGPAVRCPELYDPTAKTFTELACTDAGQGAYPMTGLAENEHVISVEGFTANLNYDSSGAYGITGIAPTL